MENSAFRESKIHHKKSFSINKIIVHLPPAMRKENPRWRNAYRLNFYGLRDGEHQLSIPIAKTFFANFPVDDILESQLSVDIHLTKNDRHLRLLMQFHGTVKVECDVSLEDFWMNIDFNTELIVKFAEDNNFEDFDVWTINRTAHHVDLADYFYETVVVNMPVKRVNPDVVNGEKDSPVYRAYLEYLEQQEAQEPEDTQPDDEPIDPRWQALKQLKKDK
ncbi:MAG: DUF177 domain-containing protein [Cryomorphaceae bacterium]|nr:DUF177 domain-containing protein [Cryomorphaceae bacterium]